MDEEASSYRKSLFLALIIGVISGFSSLIFFEGLKAGTRFFMNTLLDYQIPLEGQSMVEIAAWAPPPNIWLILPIICVGGLLSGLIVWLIAPEVEGAGKDAAIGAFHQEGRIRGRVPFFKAIATILIISTGGSAGREGPTALISAGLGSLVADKLHLSARERRIALVAGIGAGVGAIFKAPLGGAILAAEVLYIRDFESEAIITAFLSSVVSYSIFCTFEGFDPIFRLGAIEWTITQVPLFIVLGVVCAGVGMVYIRTYFRTGDAFDKMFARRGWPRYLQPVTGAFLTGLFVIMLAQISPESLTLGLAGLNTGYGFLQLGMYSMLPLSVLILLPFVKILTSSLTISSGGSGGVFGPGLVIGGSTGGAMGTLLHLLVPGIVPASSIPAFIVVGMIALFGAIANAPLAVMIMVVEMTGDFSLLVPAMGAVAVSHLLTGEESIFAAQVQNKSFSDAHRGEYEVQILERIPAGEAMVELPSVIALSPEDAGEHVLGLIDTTGHTGFPVIDGGRLVGVITIGDVRELQAEGGLSRPVSEGMATDLITINTATTLEEALRLMISHDLNHLPVVDPDMPDRMVGFLTRSDIMRAYAHRVSLPISRQGMSSV